MSQVFCAEVDDLAVLALEGGNPFALLQGQLTCDLRQVSPQQALPGLLCSLKGRVLSSMEVISLAEDQWLLVLPADNLALVEAHLKKYQPFYKTQVRDASERWHLLGLSGKESPALLTSLFGGWPSGVYTLHASEPGVILRLPGARTRALVLLDRQAPDYTACVEKIQSISESTDLGCWKMLDIQAGRAQIGQALSDAYLPQMLNYQAQGAVSFKKGCYTGQEIVARAQFRGQVKKRLFRVHLACEVPSHLPQPVWDESGQTQGEIIQAASDRQGQTEALALLSIKATEAALAFWTGSQDNPIRLNCLQLPYDPQARIGLHGAEV